MKLHQLEIENYGIFSGEKFDFCTSGLQLIQGPNEAGKSTLLQLLREVFFGFPVKNRYDFTDTRHEMAAVALVELSDGRRVRFRRRKGNKDVLVGLIEDDGAAVDENVLDSLLGRANARLYENVFGFSLSELVAGERSLKDANISQALYGGGMGGLANFQQAQTALKNEHEQLFKSQGRSGPTINRLLKEIKQSSTDLNKLMVLPREYKQRRAACDEAEAAVAELRRRRDELQLHFDRLDRLQKTLPAWLRLTDVEKEMSDLDIPQQIAPDAEKDYRGTQEEIDSIRGELAEEQEALEAAQVRMDSLDLRPRFLDAETAGMVKSLEQDVGEIKRFRRDLPLRAQEADNIRHTLGSAVARLNPNWDITFLEQFTVAAAQEEAVTLIAEEIRNLTGEKKILETQAKEKTRKLADANARLNMLDAELIDPRLEELSHSAGRYEADLLALVQTDEEIAAADIKIEELQRGLVALADLDCENIASLAVPLEATIGEFADRFKKNNDALSQIQAKLESLQVDLADNRHKLVAIDEGQAVPDRGQLKKSRKQRDTGWQLIRRGFVAGQDIEQEFRAWLAEITVTPETKNPDSSAGNAIDQEDINPLLAEKFEQAIVEADRLADLRQEKAELVAAREQLVSETRRLENKLHELEKFRDSRTSETKEIESQWSELWLECHITPKRPDVMRQWLHMHGEFVERWGRRKMLADRRDKLREQIKDYERRLAEAMGDSSDSPQLLILEAKRRITTTRDSLAERRQLEKEKFSLQRELDDLANDLEQTAEKQRQCRERLQTILNEIGFPRNWEAAWADKVLKELHAARLKLQKAIDLDVRIADMRRELADYETRARCACEQLAPEWVDLAAEAAAVALSECLAEAKQSQKTHEELIKTVADVQRRIKTKSAKLESLQNNIQRLREAAGADCDDEFFRIAALAQHKADLQNEAGGLIRDIKTAAQTDDIEEFRDRLAQTDVNTLRGELQKANDELASAETLFEQAKEDAGAAKNELRRFDGGDTAARAAAELQSRRAELYATVERWASLVLAEKLMQDAVDRFEREHQPALLKSAGQLFSAMTLGRYTGVCRRLDQQKTILVEDKTGRAMQPSQLSTGTREQLYLAIRLAYVRQYCQKAEPLPLVMDDVLVNFDDDRAGGTLDVLLEIAADVQVIFLTCHRQTADRIAKRLPQMTPICLATP